MWKLDITLNVENSTSCKSVKFQASTLIIRTLFLSFYSLSDGLVRAAGWIHLSVTLWTTRSGMRVRLSLFSCFQALMGAFHLAVIASFPDCLMNTKFVLFTTLVTCDLSKKSGSSKNHFHLGYHYYYIFVALGLDRPSRFEIADEPGWQTIKLYPPMSLSGIQKILSDRAALVFQWSTSLRN